MINTVQAWQCIGCGRIDHPANCIGVCDYRPIDLVYACDLGDSEARVQELTVLVRQLALATPAAGQWERSYRVLQARARALLGLHAARKSEPDRRLAAGL